jgi:two-component system, chemotaxis family, CheB/CheR fusion protein
MPQKAVSRSMKEPRPPRRKSHSRKKRNSFPVVGIGASAGGFESISTLLKNLRPDTGLAFVIIQHLGPESHSTLANLLLKTTSMPVLDIRDGMPIDPNHVYVLTPNFDVVVENRKLRLVRRPSSERVHMPIDHFFQSLAEQEKERAIGVVLSGTGSDGTLGLRAIKGENGLTFAEADTTAKYFAMPNSAIRAGCVDAVRTIKDLAHELEAVARHPYVKDRSNREANEVKLSGFPEGADALTKVFYLLKQQTGVNFAEYKHSTLGRRIARRIVLKKLETLEDYVELLRSETSEVEQLFNDILINVTSFFRDPAAFATLRKRILTKIIKARGRRGDLRIWVPGCSTGEEVYSVAIVAMETLGHHADGIRVQVFGTDLSEQIVAKARSGIYPESIAKSVSSTRLRRFFHRTANGTYQISRTIRDICTFARQNVCEDPPFSHIDLITCRNVLIYLGPQLQKKCIPIFHYALNPDGYLMLGTSESVGGFADLFALVDKKHKIYLKKFAGVRPPLGFHAPDGGPLQTEASIIGSMNSEPEPGLELHKHVDRLILARYSPNAVVIDESLQVLQFRGATSRYLEHAPGSASLNLLQMARPPLIVDLRTAIHRALKENAAVRRADIFLKYDGEAVLVNLEVIPFRAEGREQRLLLITFDHVKAQRPEHEGDGHSLSKGRSKSNSHNRGLEVQRLRDELNSTKESLQAIIEEREAANEELKSANEEIQSSNEELQSTNEELETAKEELQSANEELTTVNEELANRNSELATVNNDLNNLLTSINIPIIIVDNGLRVRRVTAPGEKIFNLIATDVGRPLSNIKPNLDIPDLAALIREVIETLSAREREVRDSDNRWHQLRIRPYRTLDNKIDGAVITLVEIDRMKRSLADLQNVLEFANTILDGAREPILVVGEDLIVQHANRVFRERFKIARVDLENAHIHHLGDGWKLPKLRTWLTGMNRKAQRTAELQLEHKFPFAGRLNLTFRAQRLAADGHYVIVLTVCENPSSTETR